MTKPFIMGSDSAKDFLQIGIKILREKGSALDAAEQTCRAVEANPDDHGVGLGGIPNIAGEVTLDASIMDGKTVGIVLLTLTAMLLLGVLANVTAPTDVQAQGGRFSDYAMVPAAASADIDTLCVLDTKTQRMVFFEWDKTDKKLVHTSLAQLKKDFKETP